MLLYVVDISRSVAVAGSREVPLGTARTLVQPRLTAPADYSSQLHMMRRNERLGNIPNSHQIRLRSISLAGRSGVACALAPVAVAGSDQAEAKSVVLENQQPKKS